MQHIIKFETEQLWTLLYYERSLCSWLRLHCMGLSAKDWRKLERVQNLAARLVFRNYTRNFSVSLAKRNVRREPLKERRGALRLKLFHNLVPSRNGTEPEKYIFRPGYIYLRLNHVNKVRKIKCNTDVLRTSFLPRTTSNWNRLPRDAANV